MKRQQVTVQGIVQGVGFRPFVFSLAKRLFLTGWVRNNAQGVVIEVEGLKENLQEFVQALTEEAPPLAKILQVDVDEIALTYDEHFVILESNESDSKVALISPDVALCPECERELKDFTDRRFGYAFINCTHCGPRYTIIRDIPYDRPLTTMSVFPMCPSCQAEYDDPLSRRFHAQPNACNDCGPRYWLADKDGREIETSRLWQEARRLLQAGKILAIKGIGGYHLCCNALSEQAVSALRAKKFRLGKPLALMAGSLACVKTVCHVTAAEETLLASRERPIVLLKKRVQERLASSVAPGNAYLGVMLPYAPFHHLLLQPEDLLVMTSGNKSEEPLAYGDGEAFDRLARLADYFLVHDREIFRPIDDSVVRIVREKPAFIRRSRGYVPVPLILKWDLPQVLAAGGEQKNTFCLTRGRQAFVSAHIGDLENEATYHHYCANIEHLCRLTHIEPAVIAYDLHPRYFSTQYALAKPWPQVAIQHHHAHIASVMAEHGIDQPVIGVAFDGTGYGTDGHLWGGEFLVATLTDFERAAHLAYFPLPGGAKSIQEPWRLAAFALHKIYGKDMTNLALPVISFLPQGWELVVQAAEKGLHSPLTSSAGRLFDMAAALLGIRFVTYYEGQAAIELEQLAGNRTGKLLPYEISSDNCLDFLPAMAALAEGKASGEDTAELAASFQRTLGQAVVEIVGKLGYERGIRTAALSGGVFQNLFLLNYVIEKLQAQGFQVFWNQQIPANDGGLSLGQAVVAGMRRNRECV